jgi:hypothetical protein
MDSQDKEKIIGEFETLKSFELSAHGLYTRIAHSPRVTEPKIGDIFAGLADERRHADLVQEIIDLVSETL